MDRLRQMEVFAAVADARSFARAAAALGMSRPAASRHVAALEAELGVQLLHRSARRVALTDVGTSFLADCLPILEAISEAQAAARGAHHRPTGCLRLTAPVLFGRRTLAPLLPAFLAAHPAITAELSLLDRVTALVDEGFDAALRVGPLPDSDLRAVRVGQLRRLVVAAPSLLAAAPGAPATPAALADHPLIVHSQARRWRFAGGAVAVVPRLLTNDVATTVQAAVAGVGLAQVLSYQAAAALAQGQLVAVLSAHEPPPLPVQLVFPGGRLPARTRAFLDLAVPRLRALDAAGWPPP